MKNRPTILMLGIILLILSGCLQGGQKEELAPTPVPVSTTAIPSVTPTAISSSPEATPAPTLKILPSNTLYVKAFMLRPTSWGNEKYEINSLKVEIFNQINDPLSIKAMIMNNEQILEETSFTIGGGGGSYQFSNQKKHFINGTNITLRLFVKDYQPVDYKVNETSILD